MLTPDVRPDTTPRPSWPRHAAWAGPGYAALLVLAAVAFPAPPGGDVVAASDPDWLTGHSTAVIGQALVRALAAVSFVVLALAAAAHAHRTAPRTPFVTMAAVAGGVLTGALMLATQAAAEASAIAVQAHVGDPGVGALGALQEALLDMSSLPAALLFGAVGLTAWGTRTLPTWFGVASLIGVPVALIDAASYTGGALEPAALVGLVWFLVWSLVAGVQLARAD